MSWADLIEWPCTGSTHCACLTRQGGMCCGCGKRGRETWRAWFARLRWNLRAWRASL